MNNTVLTYISYSILVFFIIAVVSLLWISFYDNEIGFILGYPDMFIIEIIIMTIIPSLSVLVFTYTRGIKLITTAKFAGLLMFKFALLHIMLEISGYYSHIFD
jgi:hypothetical protein